MGLNHRWIETKKELPDPGVRVLAIVKNHQMEVGEFDSNGTFRFYDCWSRDIDHWMPLPAPPEER